MLDNKDYLIKGEMYQYNLGWLIEELMSFKQDLATAIDLKTIKYADPIQWDITTQYPANTVVVDPKSGTAYMSKVPVPAGVELNNANYWVVVFNYQDIYNKIMDGVAFNDRDQDYATKDLLVNDLVWYAGDLYRVTQAIPTGSKYIPGTNLVKTTIESLLARYYGRDRTAQVSNDTVNVSGDYTLVAGDIAETSANRTIKVTKDREIDVDGSDSVHVDGASTLNVGGLRTEVYAGDKTEGVTGTYSGKFGSASFETGAPSWPVKFPGKTVDLADISKRTYVSVKEYGAMGDGVHDDTDAIQKAINDNAPRIELPAEWWGADIFFPAGKYVVSDSIILPGYVNLIGEGRGQTMLYLNAGTNKPLIKTWGYDNFITEHHARWYITNQVPQLCGIKNMMLFGNKWNNNYDALVKLYGCNITFDNVYFYGYNGWGLYQDWGDGTNETWTLNYDKMSENIFRDCYFFEGDKGIYQSERCNDVVYNNIFVGRQNDVGALIEGTSYFNYAHFYDCNNANTSDYGVKFVQTGTFNLVIESMHQKPAALFSGWFQYVIAEFYGNPDMDVQLSSNYSQLDIKVNCSISKDTTVYSPGGTNNIYNITQGGGENGKISLGNIKNSILNVTSTKHVALGQTEKFTNVTGNAIGSTVDPGNGADNVWYPGKN